MIHVQNLTKRYGDLTAIDNVSFQVEKGEVLAFLGPNGAGKTTMMRILTGFMPATSGTATIAGYDIFDENQEVKKKIGYLPETPPVYTDLTVSEYLRFVAGIKGLSRREFKGALDRVLEQCSLGDVRGRLIGNLSRGFRQRVGLAQALIHDPEILILDEPTIGLDPKQIIEVRNVIKSLSGEHTVILSTHILSEATATCERVVIIHEGRIVAVDSPERLSAQIHKSEKVRIGLKTPGPDTEKVIRAIPGVLSIFKEDGRDETTFYTIEYPLGKELRPELATRAVKNNWGLVELQTITLSLEDVFLKLTQEDRPESLEVDKGSEDTK